jgi:hypothetical protein
MHPLTMGLLSPRVLSSLLDDDPQQLHQQIEACRARIQSVTMCEKLTRFAYAPREVKDMIRKHAGEISSICGDGLYSIADLPLMLPESRK